MNRARRRSQRYLTSYCKIVKPSHERDQYGFRSEDSYDDIIYEGKCFASPGNMWPFETGSDVIRGARADIQFFIPAFVEGMTPECLVEYGDGDRYEVIAFSLPLTAQATLEFTARRVS